MSLKKWSVVLGVLVVVSLLLTACPAPAPQVVEKVVTQVVEKKVKVVETQVVEKVQTGRREGEDRRRDRCARGRQRCCASTSAPTPMSSIRRRARSSTRSPISR